MSESRSLFALNRVNANGVVNTGKLSQISIDGLNTRSPHILTISETKASDKVGGTTYLADSIQHYYVMPLLTQLQ